MCAHATCEKIGFADKHRIVSFGPHSITSNIYTLYACLSPIWQPSWVYLTPILCISTYLMLQWPQVAAPGRVVFSGTFFANALTDADIHSGVLLLFARWAQCRLYSIYCSHTWWSVHILIHVLTPMNTILMYEGIRYSCIPTSGIRVFWRQVFMSSSVWY